MPYTLVHVAGDILIITSVWRLVIVVMCLGLLIICKVEGTRLV